MVLFQIIKLYCILIVALPSFIASSRQIFQNILLKNLMVACDITSSRQIFRIKMDDVSQLTSESIL
jgi:hypothetical protein